MKAWFMGLFRRRPPQPRAVMPSVNVDAQERRYRALQLYNVQLKEVARRLTDEDQRRSAAMIRAELDSIDGGRGGGSGWT